jgi:hypothetical protein
VIDAFAELTLETRAPALLESRDGDRVWHGVGERARLGLWTPGEKEFGDEGGRHGDRFIYAEDPEGNVVEVWDFFNRDEGAREGIDALR